MKLIPVGLYMSVQKTPVIRSLLVLGFVAGLWTAYTQGPPPAKIDLVKVKMERPAAPAP